MPASPPIPQTQLQEIVQQACESVLSNVTTYNHADVDKQNGDIISSILNALVSSTTTSASSPQYKFAVNSTIIQHLSDPSSTNTSTSTGTHTTSAHALATQPGNSHSSSSQADAGTTTGAPADALGANEADARTSAENPIAGLDGAGSGGAGAGGINGTSGAQVGGMTGQAPSKGRRGMHSATGAYWNEDTDGMWSWKYDGADRGMDVVVSVVWVGV